MLTYNCVIVNIFRYFCAIWRSKSAQVGIPFTSKWRWLQSNSDLQDLSLRKNVLNDFLISSITTLYDCVHSSVFSSDFSRKESIMSQSASITSLPKMFSNAWYRWLPRCFVGFGIHVQFLANFTFQLLKIISFFARMMYLQNYEDFL